MKSGWLRGKRFRVALITVLLLSGAVFSYWQFLRPTVAEETPELKTAKVREGDIRISMNAIGDLAVSQEVTLGFDTSGRVEEVAVKIGQEVQAGDLLVSLASGDAQAAVRQAEIALRSAELKLQELTDEAAQAGRDTALANLNAAEISFQLLTAEQSEDEIVTAQAVLDAQRADAAGAQASVKSAQENLGRLLAGPTAEDLGIAERKVELAKNTLWATQGQRDAICGRPSSTQADCDLAQANVQKNEEDVRIAQLQLELLQRGPSAAEIASAEAQLAGAKGQLANAEAQLLQAEASFDALRAGPSADVIANAEARVVQAREAVAKLSDSAQARALESAELAIQQAQVNLDLVTDRLDRMDLRAPFEGRVVGIQAGEGEQVGSSAIVSLASTSQGVVRFFVEETDLSMVAVGTPVSVVFRAVPDLVYAGQILWLSPVMSPVDGVASAEVLAEIDLGEHTARLLPGMEAEIEVIAALTENALLVPMDAIRALGTDAYGVFVVGEDGKLELREVEIGLQDFASAEVISGLTKGEIVSTGTIDTN